MFESPIWDALQWDRRQQEVNALIAQALDPADPYDGHHGNDRSPESVAHAEANDPELADRLKEKIRTAAPE
jgi:hypothetical protein